MEVSEEEEDEEEEWGTDTQGTERTDSSNKVSCLIIIMIIIIIMIRIMAIALETSDQGTWSSNKMSPHLKKSDGDKIEKSDHNGVGRCVCVWGYFPLGRCVCVGVGVCGCVFGGATVDTRGTEMSDVCNKVSIENSQDLSPQNFFGKSCFSSFYIYIYMRAECPF